MYGKSENQDLSRSQFDSARLGFLQWLRRKRMSPQFIDRHAEDLFAQACFEYSRRVSEGVEIGDPPAWIVTCAWNRTRSLLETRDYKPRLVSTESIAEPVDGRAGPEEALLDSDRGRKVRDAVKELPLYQRELLALSYFEGESIREAGRRLRWTASKAQRAHEAAQKRIFEILDVESPKDLQLEIGFFAFLSVCADRAAGHTLPAGLEAALDSAHHGLSEAGHQALSLARRPFQVSGPTGHALTRPAAAMADPTKEIEGRGPFGRIADFARRLASGGAGEAGTAIAGEGGGRALEVCKGLAVCVMGGSAITTALIAGGGHPAWSPAHDRRPPAKVARNAPVSKKPVLQTARTSGAVFDEAETATTATRSMAPRPAERHPSVAKAPKVEEAATAGPARTGDRRSQETADTEEQFQDFGATEGSGSGSTATQSTSTAESATTGTTGSGSGGSGVSPAKKTEEAQAAKQFHGLLE